MFWLIRSIGMGKGYLLTFLRTALMGLI